MRAGVNVCVPKLSFRFVDNSTVIDEEYGYLNLESARILTHLCALLKISELLFRSAGHSPRTMDPKMEVIHQEDAVSVAPRFVPGTEILYDFGKTDGVDAARLHDLQHVKHGDANILLVPQPSLDDESDPLRWPAWKKSLTLFNGLWYSFNGAITGPIMAAGAYCVSVD